MIRPPLLASLLAVSLRLAHADPNVPIPDGYHQEPYRAPTPDMVPGGRVIHTDALREMLHTGHVVLIDVMTVPRRPEGMRADAPWMPLPRRDIPGSVLLPDIGRGAISPELEQYLQSNLERLTRGDRDAAIVFYCLGDCWMSWNAAKRAANFGWRNVFWYPEGSDGWEAAGMPLLRTVPEPME